MKCNLNLSIVFKVLVCLIASVFVAVSHAQQIKVVSVTSSGFGKTEAEALLDAVVNGIAQVNGEAVASSIRITTSAESSTGSGSTASRTIDEDISRRTKGVVQSWRKISAEISPAGDYSASAQVNVFVLQRSEQLKRMKLAIVVSGSGQLAPSRIVQDEVSRNLTTSRKFAIMDRKNVAEIESQLARIRKGGSLEDSVRLSAEVAPDFIAVVSVTSLGRPDGRRTAYATLDIIDYSSRQLKFSEKKSVPLKTGDQVSNERRLASISKGLSRTIIQSIFPPIVLGTDGGFITVGQGSDFFNMGDKLVIKRMGATLRDPHTGEYLSQDQSDIGTATITYVDRRIARAKLDKEVSFEPALLAKKNYQVWRSGETAGDAFGGLGLFVDGDGSASAGKSRRIFVTGDDDDD